MFEDALSGIQEQVETATKPARHIQEASVQQIEKLIAFQTDRGQVYTDMAFQRLRAALEVKEPEDLQAFVREQTEWVQDVTRQVTNDLRALGSLQEAFGTELQKAAEEALAGGIGAAGSLGEEARQAAQQAAQQTTEGEGAAAADDPAPAGEATAETPKRSSGGAAKSGRSGTRRKNA